MKKEHLYTIGIVVLIIALLVTVFFIGGKSSNKEYESEISNDPEVIMSNAQKESEQAKKSELKDLVEINVNQYIDMLKSEELNLILIARPTCSYCQVAEPIIRSISYEYDFSVNYLNTDEFKDDDESEFIKSNEYFSEGFGTPLLLVVSNNEIVDKVDGLTDRAHYIEFFKTYKYIE